MNAPDSFEARSAIRALRVVQATWEAQSVISFKLADPNGGALPNWKAGAHLDLILPSSLVRQYSLCGDPADRFHYTIAVLREEGGRGGSVELHDTALLGRLVNIRGPRNHFELQPAAHYLFLAGGIGITPILAMVHAAEESGTPWTLYYGGRTRDHMSYRRELEQFGASKAHLVPQDEFGLLDLAKIVAASAVDTSVYCCGPEPMLAAAEASCASANPPRRLYLERFAAAATALTAATAERGEFEVELRHSGLVLMVRADRTLLETVREALPDVPYSCEGGYCGACETRVLEGTPEHHDQILSDDDRVSGNTMMICVGRSKSARLVLDL